MSWIGLFVPKLESQLDGVPVENHATLDGRLVGDDPDNRATLGGRERTESRVPSAVQRQRVLSHWNSPYLGLVSVISVT